eukprot:CAMPEP_0178382944 /NCGR_PEP_ID=MMETSP0689_2-20121128/6751_1 /TAXON_ID=160604 /ORGANISM="Amphidinium massartii, Strain CS-259" /LENGTH=894 /DNA_ID=CAMNT_0020003157 /DNA_START=15 /DNA_END=2696 /DNA_ORIENTATION=+
MLHTKPLQLLIAAGLWPIGVVFAQDLRELLDNAASRCLDQPGSTAALRLIGEKYQKDLESRPDPNKGSYILANNSSQPIKIQNGCPVHFGLQHDENVFIEIVRENDESSLLLKWDHDDWYAWSKISWQTEPSPQYYIRTTRLHGQMYVTPDRNWDLFHDDSDNAHWGDSDPLLVAINSEFDGGNTARYEGVWQFTFHTQSKKMLENQYNALRALFRSACQPHRDGVPEDQSFDWDVDYWRHTENLNHDLNPHCGWMAGGWDHAALSADNYATACEQMEFVDCDADGYVTHIFLANVGLDGPFPAEFADLSRLHHVDFRFNKLTGALETIFENHPSLVLLFMSHNQLSGPLPCFSGDTKLEWIDLGSNLFTGTIPSCLGDLTGLSNLELNNNELTGSLPVELGQLVNLAGLKLKSNGLTGSIPSAMCNMVKLHEVDMSINSLDGQLPQDCVDPTASLGWERLTLLDLAHNRFSGEIPTFGQRMVALKRVDLSYNSFSGSVGQQFHVMLQNADKDALTEVYLQGNLLSGPFPQVAYEMTYNPADQRIRYFDVTDNLFSCENTGRLPLWTIREDYSKHGSCVPRPVPTGEISPSRGIPGTIVVVSATDVQPNANPSCKLYQEGGAEVDVAGSVLDSESVPQRIQCYVPAALSSTDVQEYKVTVANFGQDFSTTAYWADSAKAASFNPPSFVVDAIEMMEQGVIVSTTIILTGVTASTFNEPAFRQTIAELTSLPESDIFLQVGGRRLQERSQGRHLQTTLAVGVDCNIEAPDPSSPQAVAEAERVEQILRDSDQVRAAMTRGGFIPQSYNLEVSSASMEVPGVVTSTNVIKKDEENLGLGLGLTAAGVVLVCCLCSFVCFIRYREKKGQPYFQETLDEGNAGGGGSGATYGNTSSAT